MKILKRILSVIACVCVSFLVACKDTKDPTNPESSDPVTTTISIDEAKIIKLKVLNG